MPGQAGASGGSNDPRTPDMVRQGPRPSALLTGLRRNRSGDRTAAASEGVDGNQSNPHHKAAGLPALTLHDLRRSFSNLSKWVEVPVGVVAQLMGHKPSATAEKHYKPRPLDLLRMWHTRIEAWILEQAGIEQPHAEQKGPQAVPSTTAA